MFEVRSRVLGCAVLSLLNVIDSLGGCDPSLCGDVVDTCVDALGIVFGEESQVFSVDDDFSPNALSQHGRILRYR